MMNAERVNVTPAQQVDQNVPPVTLSQQRQRKNQVQYQLKQVIGKGSYGIVYKAINRKTEQMVAIKEVTYDDDEELTDIMSEIDLLKNLNHMNIVKYHGFIKKSHNLYIILEYCSRGSLKNVISRGKGIPESKAKVFIKQTLNGLHYLHEQGVIHRDIKAANLLLDSNSVVKLADFGVSTKVNTMTMAMTLAGSLNWMAPEIIGNRGASTLSDIWSLGATVLELLTGHPPFHNLVDINIYYAIENDTFIPPTSLSQDAQEFLARCFQKNMYMRPTAAELLKHKWLSTTDTDKLDLFKEDGDELDYRWDQDFKESTIINTPGVESQRVSTGDSSDSARPAVRSSEELLAHLNKSNDSELSFDSLKTIFDQMSVEDIYLRVVGQIEANQEFLNALFEYDKINNSSKLKECWITLGGIYEILDQNEIIERYFLKDSYKILIQCGILRRENMDLLNDTLRLELIFRLLEVSDSASFWCNWCSQNLRVSALVSNLQNKFAQSIILKLSYFDESSNWFYGQFINEILTVSQIDSLDQQTVSFIFKALSSILIKSHKRRASSSLAQSLSHSSNFTSQSSLCSLPSSTVRSSVSKAALSLPPEFLPWLLRLLDEDLFYNIKNLHLWRYFFLVIHHSTHLNKALLNRLLHSSRFLTLNLKFLLSKDDPSFLHEECRLPIVQLSLSIITEVSMEMDSFSPLLQRLAVAFLKFDDECIAGGLEILFNYLQFALHSNLRISKTIKGLAIIPPMTSSNAQVFNSSESDNFLNYQEVIDPFFNVHEDNIQFGNFIATFIKIYSLGPFDVAAMNIILHPDFVKRSILFFDQYRNSLLIQIDLLKFIKLAFGRALDFYNSKSKSKAPLSKDVARQMSLKLQELNFVLENNWNSQQAGQIGCDSILIHQLCQDIKSLSLQTPSSYSMAHLR
ncbi:serine/threonine protein kinase CDC15 TDEL_0D04460 [Torulaspora delbrueckii]|uniref:non-specific serine/threonine protein kinase n=1 Tax=Torulaspora delbrueckii TaxID=4950 RepID=G8ZTT6_TORDE|nr:hypothetical protein TDEL_0D04460 [Torulaspora delbrueckii]CCE92030.1 hypothetical protein TDEL_0D04460 [Torulaspora delbrueckii]